MKNEFYKIDDLASLWKVSRENIFRMAEMGELSFSLKWKGFCVSNSGRSLTDWKYIDEFVNLPPNTSAQFWEANHVALDIDHQESVRVLDAIRQDGQEVWLHVTSVSDEYPRKEDVAEDGRLLRKKTVRAPQIFCNQLVILAKEVERIEAENSHGRHNDERAETMPLDDPWITGNDDLCKAFRVGKKSLSAVRRKVKLAGLDFDYEPETKKKRLRSSTIIKILTFD